MSEKNQQPDMKPESENQGTQIFNLDDIMKEFASDETETVPAADADVKLYEEPVEKTQQEPTPEETIRIDLPPAQDPPVNLGDTVRLENIEQLGKEVQPEAEIAQAAEDPADLKDPEAFSEKWQPEFEQPMGEYEPPQPIIFHPRSRLRELKRKLVAGPERRYYEINEIGFGKLQAAIFFSFLLVVLAVGTTVMYALGSVEASRLKLMVFFQIFTMMMSALMGCYQMLDGIGDLFRGRITLNTMLVFTFLACCADGFLCLQEQRIPCCAAFCLQVLMALWAEHQKRNTEMAMMDTMRKAVNLNGIKLSGEYYDRCDGLLRGEGQVEDFMDHYKVPSRPEKVFSWYGLAALLISIGSSIAAGVLHGSVSFAMQVLAVSLLAAVPVTSFICLSRPMAVLERRLHKLGAVLCGWRGIVGLSHRAVFPVNHEDLFPLGSCKLNGVKFYGSRDPDQVVAYCTALVVADGGGLVPLFDHLLSSRNGRHYEVQNLRGYNGGIGGEVCDESVLLGSLNFLKEMGVEIPAGTSVSQAVYAAIDGELCGVFAVTYNRMKSAYTGLRTLCGYRGLKPLLITRDFMLTEEFLRGRFGINTRRMYFPQREVRDELAQIQPETAEPALALITSKGLAPYAYAVTGARSVRTASWIGVVIHLIGGILGLGMMLTLSILGAGELLTPQNLLLYHLIWMIPGLLITEWTRSL